MVSSPSRLTVESIISTPKRSPARSNAAGTCAVFATSSYSFAEHKELADIRFLDLKTGQCKVLSDASGVESPAWVFDDQVLWLRKGTQGTTDLVVGWPYETDAKPQTIAIFEGPVSDLKVAVIDEDTRALAVTGPANPNGELYNPEKAKTSLSSARAYTSLFVRHWDKYATENTSSIFYATLTRAPRDNRSIHSLSTTPLANALAGHPSGLSTPVGPFFKSTDWDISSNGIVFVSLSPNLNPSLYMSSNVYHIPLTTFNETKVPAPVEIKTGVFRGTSQGPRFSPDGKSIAFTRQRAIEHESDKARLFVVPDLEDPSDVQEFFESSDGQGAWDVSVLGTIEWSADGKNLFFVVNEEGRQKLYTVPSSPRNVPKIPSPWTHAGCVTGIERLSQGEILVTSNSFCDDTTYTILRPQDTKYAKIISSSTKGGRKYGLNTSQVSECWYQGAAGYPVHTWIFKPSKFDEAKRYPVALMIHGGPQSAIYDSWSSRWNMALFAEQGFVVVAPNFTGSSGFGFAHQDAIRDDWGGAPYRDIELAFQHVEAHLPYADTSRAIGMGPSFGGFMMNWIQGHPLGRKLKALVTHDGMMTTSAQMASDELFFPFYDFGGTPWQSHEAWEKSSPLKYAENWATPHLIIHSDLDYRCPVDQGLMAFNILQVKRIPSRFLNFPDEGHFVNKPENVLVWYNEVIAWIKKYAGITHTGGDVEVTVGSDAS